jgi:glutamyl-tRNA synthetase
MAPDFTVAPDFAVAPVFTEAPVFSKTRIAPTPSGYLHVGNVLSFAITATLARKAGASIALRIDDMDRDRVRRAYVQDIFDTLDFMGIPWDEGPRDYNDFESHYAQVHRMHLYNKALDQLRAEGKVFACSCSRSDLVNGTACHCRNANRPLDTPQTTWRVFTDPGAQLTGAMTDFIVRKRDGFPAYQLSSVIDDLHYAVDFIVRGQDLWPSTLAQLYLGKLLGETRFNSIRFYHHSLLCDLNGEKLSKSAGSTSIQRLRLEGFQPNQIYTLIARMLGHEGEVSHYTALGELALKESFA